MADKYFGNEDPMGKILSYEGEHEFMVTGILNNFPNNSHLAFNFIIPFQNNVSILGLDLNSWGWNFCHTYCILREGTNPTELEKKSNAFLIKHRYDNKVSDRNKNAQLYFFPITDIYLHPPAGGVFYDPTAR